MTPGVPGTRDERIDWLRGLALASIFVNHMPGNRFENWTSRNFGFSDAAELFVLLAGVAAAFAYFKRFARGEESAASLKAGRRAGKLYVAHIASTFAAVLLFMGAATLFANPDYLDLIDVAPLVEEPWPGIVGVLTGGFQLGYFNILPMYVLLLAALPGYMWLAKRDLRLMLGVSAALYVAAQVLSLDMPNFPAGGGWFFNPFAWQLVFAIGLALGILKMRGQTVPYHPAFYGTALIYVLFSFIWMVWSLGGHLTHGLLPGWMDTLHKSNLPPPRLLHLMALAYVLVHSRVWARLVSVAATDPVFTRLGRNSLPVFVAGSLLSMVGYITLVQFGESFLPLEIALTVAGLAIMVVVAFAAEGRFAPILVATRARLPRLPARQQMVTFDTTERTTPTSSRR